MIAQATTTTTDGGGDVAAAKPKAADRRRRERAAGAANHARAGDATDATTVGAATKPDAKADTTSPSAKALDAKKTAGTTKPPPELGAVKEPPPPPKTASEAYARALDAPPSQMATAWASSSQDAGSALHHEDDTFRRGLPTFEAKLQGAHAPARTRIAPVAAREVAALSDKQPVAPVVAPPSPVAAPTQLNTNIAARAVTLRQVQPERLRQEAQQMIASVDTRDDVDTTGGTREQITLTGGADPKRADTSEAAATAEVAIQQTAAEAAVVSNPGAQHVQPIELTKVYRVAPTPEGALDGLAPPPGPEQLAKWNLRPKELAAFDAEAAPRMHDHLADARAQIGDGDDQRRTDQKTAVDDTATKVDVANADADAAQNKEVAAARQDIVDAQKDALQEQHDAVADAREQADQEKQGTLSDVDKHVETKQGEIDAKYDDGHREAEVEKQKGDDKADQARRDAEEDKSWWDDVCDAVSSVIDSIVSVIDDIFDAVKSAIGAIFDAIKDVVCDIIDAVRDFVNDALDALGAALKFIVDNTIGLVFPDVARRLDKAIDDTIDDAKAAVNAAADALKKGISALLDGLHKLLDKCLSVFKGIIHVAAALAKAAIRGDWSEVARILIDGLLSVLGIDPADFWAFVAKIKKTIGKIVDDPGAFVDHLLDAVKQGFELFSDNFPEHLRDAFFEWVFGATNVTMPRTLDLAGLFDMAVQILGITRELIRGKVVKLIGEKNVERIEWLWGAVQTVIEKGWSGLWEYISEFLPNLAESVIEQVITWLTETIVKQAAIHLAVLFVPFGAILELIRTAWNLAMWLRENASRIKQLFVAIVDSLADITDGKIDAAAKWIEKALAKLLPAAISLVADLVGIGGIPDAVRRIVERIRAAVDKALDWVVAKLQKIFGKKGDPEKPDADGAIGKPLAFTSDGHAHTMWVTAKGKVSALMIASTPRALTSYLKMIETTHQAKWEKQLPGLPEGEQKTKLAADIAKSKALLDQAGQVAARVDRKPTGTDDEKKAIEAEVAVDEAKLASLIQELEELHGIEAAMTIPPIEVAAARMDPPFAGTLIEDVGTAAGSYKASQSATALEAKAKLKLKPGVAKLALGAAPADLSKSQLVRTAAMRLLDATDTATATFKVTASELSFDVTLGGQTATGVVTGKRPRDRKTRLDAFRATRPLKKDEQHYRAKVGDHAYTEASEVFEASDYAKFVADDGLTQADVDRDLHAAYESFVSKLKGGKLVVVGGAPHATEVIDLKDAVRDPDLEAAVGAGGIVKFLAQIVETGRSGKIDLKRLIELWGDHDNENRKFLKRKFRDADDGTHEWIPTAQIPTVLEYVSSFEGPAAKKAVDWLKMHHELRTDTDKIIFNPTHWVARTHPTRGTLWVPQGHVGAVFLFEARQTNGTTTFNNRLVSALEGAIKARETAGVGVQRTHRVMLEWLWNPKSDDATKFPIYDDPSLRAKAGRALTAAELPVQARKDFDDIDAMFTRVEAKYP
nr:hypothetical protein [Kofleriaceae bacterium]